MKNTKIMAVLVVLLAAMLFVGAASAAENGGTYFVNQKVNFTGTLYLLSGDQNEVVLDSFSINAGERILPGFIGTNTGVWYDNTTKASSEKYYSIWYPEITLMGELSEMDNGHATSSGDTINGKTINKDTDVSFIIVAPKLGGVNVSADDGRDAIDTSALTTNATVKIVFTTPANGKTTMFGGEDFTKIELNATQVYAKDAVVSPGDNAIAGTWTAQAEFDSPKSFADYAEKSNSISFTVQSTSVSITAAKDSVIRSNPFTVTIQGKSLTPYAVYLETPSASDVNPTLQNDQIGFQTEYDFTDGKYEVVDGKITYDGSGIIGGIFNTDASGQRIVQFNTGADTEDKTYTVKVSALTKDASDDDKFDTATYDKVKVKVEKGAVTITASGDGQYYIGQEITLSGTNTDSNDVFLFITGPNLAADGINLKMVEQKKDEASYAYMNNQPVSVNTDYTWEYKWDTSKCGLDTGAYTIYATSMLTNGKSSADKNITGQANAGYGKEVTKDAATSYWAVKLSDAEYATVSVNLKQPFLSAVPSGTVVAKGDKIYISGTAEGDPSYLQLYIFGPNKFVRESITVEDDGSYEKKLDIGSDWASNQYYVVIEHPMYNGEIDVQYQDGNLFINNTESSSTIQSSFNVDKLQGANAADALTKMIDNPNIDDIYTKLTFTVAEPWIKVENPGDQATGTKFTISGTTNLAVDDQILVEVMSSSFEAVDKTSTSITDGVSMTTKVVAGEGTDNVWSVEVDTTNWKLDEYTIKASGIEVDVTTTTNFNVVEKVVTPTATATGATPTTTATATATATATPATPGFGAFVALAGLGAVALLVLRRN